MWLSFCLMLPSLFAQTSPLTVAKIMQDPKTWIGASPSNVFWSEDGETLYFNWNPQGKFPADSLFKVSKNGTGLQQVSPSERRALMPAFSNWHSARRVYSLDFNKKLLNDEGDLWLYDRLAKKRTRLSHTTASENIIQFARDDKSIFFSSNNNVYRLDLTNGAIFQLTDIRATDKPATPPPPSAADVFLREQQQALFDVVRERTERQKAQAQNQRREGRSATKIPVFYHGNKRLQGLNIDPNGRFVTFQLSRPSNSKNTIVQNYVTDDGYAADLQARPKVGEVGNQSEFYIMDLQRDTTYAVDFTKLPEADFVPQFMKEQGKKWDKDNKRVFIPSNVVWSYDGSKAVMQVGTFDNKSRWIVRLDATSGKLSAIDTQHDEAWIGGPGIGTFGGRLGWLPDHQHIFFQSEKSGYSHLYIADATSGKVTQLTDGKFEVFSPQISKDGKNWFFTSSEGSPFERHFYTMPIMGGARSRLTNMVGNNEIALSPDEMTMGMTFSYSNRPPEVYLQKPKQNAQKITSSPTPEWLAYSWRDPEIKMIPASDGAQVPARVYMPKNPNGAAVLFVHGAGYLQNVHKWWSTYFREYMFHNLLTDLGYVVMDLDYRASSGYGRNWRTDIYRHMGGRDLQDYVDASKYLQTQHKIDPERIGIYGGSYGGFITLMALFTESKHFGAGAALRSVTDWAHYNHGYTSNILNTPALDSLAIARSSPIYFAKGLEDPLLMCHGVVDVNVQFQDIVRLTQKLIELGKENWELAIYPVEDHGFVEPTSWTDEYRRILKLFEENIGANRKKP